MAWSPSYRAPRFREMADPRSFADRPTPAADLTGRAFLSGHHDGSSTARLVAVQPFMGELARCPHLRGLRRLDLSGNRIGPAGVRELARSPYLAHLEKLDLSGNDLGPDGMAALRAAPWFGGLRVLGLADNGLGVGNLAKLPAGLVSLDVSDNPLGLAGAGAIRRAMCGPLDAFWAVGCDLGPAGVGLLDLAETIDLRRNRLGSGAAWPDRLGHLITLDLRSNDLGDDAMAGLTRADGLRLLGLGGNRLTAAGVAALALPLLVMLDLSANPLGDAGSATALDGRFPVLTRFNLSNTGLTEGGVAKLVRTPAAGRLRSLLLAWNRIGDAGAKALAACPDLAGLEELDLTGTGIGFAGAVALAESHHLRLRSLAVGDNPRLPADAVGMLAERFGRLV